MQGTRGGGRGWACFCLERMWVLRMVAVGSAHFCTERVWVPGLMAGGRPDSVWRECGFQGWWQVAGTFLYGDNVGSRDGGQC